MAKITRKTQKIFADSAAASQITVFGSIKENSPNPPDYSKDPDLIQSNEFMQGWTGATQDDYAPYRQDMNAIQYLVTRQLAYLFQAGIPEYDSSTQYFANCSFCQINGVIYLCIQDALNKLPTTEPTYWKEIDFSKFAPKDSPAFTGNPTAPTQLSTDNSTKLATTAFVKNVLGGFAPIDSPTFTGTPTSTTPAVGDISTKIATTQFVFNAMSGASINMPLFHHFWSDYEVNDVNFLRADTFSWQDGTAYEGPYNHLVDDIDGKTIQTETVEGITIQFYEADDGHKICPASEEANILALYTMSGVAWYYILDTVNQRFKLPRKNPIRENLITLMRAKGNGKSLGWTNGADNAGTSIIGGEGIMARSGNYGVDNGTATSGIDNLGINKAIGITKDHTKSGIIIDPTNSNTVFAGNKYLYFYVGNFTQIAIENTAGLNASLFNGKADRNLRNIDTNSGADAVIEFQNPTAENNYTWYRKYASGWVEQGGVEYFTDSSSIIRTITLPVEMIDVNYNISVCSGRIDNNPDAPRAVGYYDKNTTGFGYILYSAGGWTSQSTTCSWKVEGMAAGV